MAVHSITYASRPSTKVVWSILMRPNCDFLISIATASRQIELKLGSQVAYPFACVAWTNWVTIFNLSAVWRVLSLWLLFSLDSNVCFRKPVFLFHAYPLGQRIHGLAHKMLKVLNASNGKNMCRRTLYKLAAVRFCPNLSTQVTIRSKTRQYKTVVSMLQLLQRRSEPQTLTSPRKSSCRYVLGVYLQNG